jgi:ribose 5-phosphate isomerase B
MIHDFLKWGFGALVVSGADHQGPSRYWVLYGFQRLRNAHLIFSMVKSSMKIRKGARMKIAVACDHAGFLMKPAILETVRIHGHEVLDLGTNSAEPVDYPDYARKLGLTIQSGQCDRGILLCGSGVGACIAVNKMRAIYASVCHDTYSAHQGVEHDDMNVLCIGPRVIGSELAKEIVTSFLAARFQGYDQGQERHARRVQKVRDMEKSLTDETR